MMISWYPFSHDQHLNDVQEKSHSENLSFVNDEFSVCIEQCGQLDYQGTCLLCKVLTTMAWLTMKFLSLWHEQSPYDSLCLYTTEKKNQILTHFLEKHVMLYLS